MNIYAKLQSAFGYNQTTAFQCRACLLSRAVINTSTKANGGGKGLFHLKVYSPSWTEAKAGTQGRNLELGAEVEVIEGQAH